MHSPTSRLARSAGFAREGADCAIIDGRLSKAEQLAAEIGALGRRSLARARCDQESSDVVIWVWPVFITFTPAHRAMGRKREESGSQLHEVPLKPYHIYFEENAGLLARDYAKFPNEVLWKLAEKVREVVSASKVVITEVDGGGEVGEECKRLCKEVPESNRLIEIMFGYHPKASAQHGIADPLHWELTAKCPGPAWEPRANIPSSGIWMDQCSTRAFTSTIG
ncbi:MAG TPA: hypothetical protein VFY96_08020 [Candidatus Binatia bacterium]|nr:hypothetical protein [Candidatus Binatia bacterium]